MYVCLYVCLSVCLSVCMYVCMATVSKASLHKLYSKTYTFSLSTKLFSMFDSTFLERIRVSKMEIILGKNLEEIIKTFTWKCGKLWMSWYTVARNCFEISRLFTADCFYYNVFFSFVKFSFN